MKTSDAVLLGKKIGVGIVIALVPLGILTGGLWVVHGKLKLNKNPQPAVNHSVEASHAN